MAKFFEVKGAQGAACEDVLRILYPRRVNFTYQQIQDAGFAIKRIGYMETIKIAEWAARKITLQDGRYEAFLRTVRKHVAEMREFKSK